MATRGTRHSLVLGVTLGLAVLASRLERARAQTMAPGPGPTTTLDPYGNAVPTTVYRRPIGVRVGQGQPPDFTAPGGYRLLRGRTGRRHRTSLGSVAELRKPSLGVALSQARQARAVESRSLGRAFSLYGGFERRAGAGRPANIRTILTRRYELIRASAHLAPARRAHWRAGGDPGRRTIPSEAAAQGAPPLGQVVTAVTVEERMQAAAQHLHSRMHQEAWEWFRNGNYRRAARAFQSAVTLAPKDLESRIGELVSQVSLGATRTAVAALAELSRRFENPFSSDIHLSGRYGVATDLFAIRARSKLYVQSDGVDAGAVAVHVLVLWYLGEQDEAFQAAARLGKRFPRTAYADWVEKLRAFR